MYNWTIQLKMSKFLNTPCCGKEEIYLINSRHCKKYDVFKNS